MLFKKFIIFTAVVLLFASAMSAIAIKQDLEMWRMFAFGAVLELYVRTRILIRKKLKL